MDDREAQFKQLVAEFPDSPMGHFSLGKLYLDRSQWREAAGCLERAAQLDHAVDRQPVQTDGRYLPTVPPRAKLGADHVALVRDFPHHHDHTLGGKRHEPRFVPVSS